MLIIKSVVPDSVVRPTETLLTECFLGHLEVVLGHLPLLLLLHPHLVQLLLDDHFVVISKQ